VHASFVRRSYARGSIERSRGRVPLVSAVGEEALAAYVDAAAGLTEMPLTDERAAAVAVVLARIAGFAADLDAFALGDDVDIAGAFTP
jgi:hypothetical protein